MLESIVAAADVSEEGRTAIVTAVRLGQRSGARVTVLTVAESEASALSSPRLLESLRETVASQLAKVEGPCPTVDVAMEVGLPGIEIARFAETSGADLLVVGRKRRTSLQRLMIGDTADSVARRSRLPCLFVRAGVGPIARVLVALDGTERGLAIFPVALDFARETKALLRATTVEPAHPNEADAPWVHHGRSARLAEALEVMGRRGAGESEAGLEVPSEPWLVVHRGQVVEEVLKEVRLSSADVLVLGCRRGGPPGSMEAGSIARRLLHVCPISVLTVPV